MEEILGKCIEREFIYFKSIKRIIQSEKFYGKRLTYQGVCDKILYCVVPHVATTARTRL